MARRKLNSGIENAVTAEARSTYGGPTPPIGMYRCVIRGIKLKANRNGDDMYSVMVVIDHATDEPKNKFNGYVRTWNGNMTPQGTPYVRQFGEAAGFSPRELDSPDVDDDGIVTKIGNKPVGGQRVRVSFKDGGMYENKRTLDVGSFFPDAPDRSKPAIVAEDDDEFDPSTDDDDDYVTVPVSDEDDTEYEPEGEDEDDDAGDNEGVDEFEDDEPVEEPAPAKKAPAKRGAF